MRGGGREVFLIELQYIRTVGEGWREGGILNRATVHTVGEGWREGGILNRATGMKLSFIKPTSKVRGLSIEPRSSTGCID